MVDLIGNVLLLWIFVGYFTLAKPDIRGRYVMTFYVHGKPENHRETGVHSVSDQRWVKVGSCIDDLA